MPAGKSPGSSPGSNAATVRPKTSEGLGTRPPRVRVDQATIKISAVDRERFMVERVEARGSGVAGFIGWVKRLFGGEDTR
jgi:hypothetical protein